jgi:glycine/D-amino acid oxidase-like deaminating enzyme
VILLAHAISEECEGAVVDEHLRYRPDLARKGPRALARALVAERPSILIVRAPLDVDSALAWRAVMPGVPLLVVSERLVTDDATSIAASGVELRTLDPQPDADRFAVAALRLAERTWTRLVTCAGSRAPGPRAGRVALVGAGIVNLMTALALAGDGREVIVFEAAPDPRTTADPSVFGCTSGGDNARMFTLTEADNYNDKRYEPSGDINLLLDRPVSACGWRIVDGRPLLSAERRWVDEYRDIPPWLAHAYTEDILSFNREAGELWAALRRDEPGLFENVALRDGIVRLYTDADHFRAQVERQQRVGAQPRALDLDELVQRHPALAAAAAGAAIVGAIEVVGFTVAIHDFVAGILAVLEQRGVRLRFDERVHELLWRGDAVDGVVTDAGVTRTDDYVISAGAYGDDLLVGMVSHGQIQGVLGAWLTIPNLEPQLEHSLKVSRRGHTAEDSNITVANDRDGRPVLILGSGYGWVGLDPANIDSLELEGLFAAVEDTASRLFPRGHAAAVAADTLTMSRRVCVRPWTSSSLGIFERVPARGGGATIVTGAHNTGGFAQAPAVAVAVVRALRGKQHPMHVLYHPSRRRRFLGTRHAQPTLAA